MTPLHVPAVTLSISGELVTQLLFDYAVSICTDGSLTRIETPFTLITPDSTAHDINPGHPTHAELMLKLHATTVDGEATDDGILRLNFSNGFTIEVEPHSHYESFSLTRNDGEMIVSQGGRLTHFGPRP